MTFEKAIEKVFDRDEKKFGTVFAERNTLSGLDELKIAAKVWNIVALALEEKGLDDFIIINNVGGIVSIPLKEENIKDDSKGKSKSPKTETASDDAVNGKEEKSKESPATTKPVK